MEMKIVHIPLLANPAEYEVRLKESLPGLDVIRWCISHVENGVAVCEAVTQTIDNTKQVEGRKKST